MSTPSAQPRRRRSAPPDPAPPTSNVVIPEWRIIAIFGVALLLIARVVLRLTDLQIIQRESLAAMASREIAKEIVLQPNRGMIVDAQGNILAMDVERQSLWANPTQLSAEKAPRLALTIAPLVNQEIEHVLEALTRHDAQWVPVARWLEPKVAAQIALLDEPGLYLVYEPRRFYPQSTFAAHVVGAVNDNGDGITGVESFYNTALKGITGTLQAEFDSGHNPIAIAPLETEPARDGENLRLTIDSLIQNVIEEELKAGIEKQEAEGGTIIVMDPQTGAIRGMTSWPTFDPNRYTKYPAEVYSRNPAVSQLYEPGSTFKIITAAAGLQSRSFTADTVVQDTGVIERYGLEIHNWNSLGNGMINVGEMLYHSSNVAAVKLNEITGPENFYSTVYDFGFGAPTGIDLGGEEQGIVRDFSSPSYDKAVFVSNSYGQGIAMTPLQLVRAVAAIANDGVLMQPYVVQERCQSFDPEHNRGTQCEVTTPTSVGRVVDQGVAWTIRRMLVHAANHYAPVVWQPRTGSYADQWLVPGYEVCAKTGTASIPLPEGGYDPRYIIGSVIGIAPAEQARYVVLVKIDRPEKDNWGVQAAIPIFQRVVERLMRYGRIAPNPACLSPGQQL